MIMSVCTLVKNAIAMIWQPIMDTCNEHVQITSGGGSVARVHYGWPA